MRRGPIVVVILIALGLITASGLALAVRERALRGDTGISGTLDPAPSGWKTYTGEGDFQFRFHYPADWFVITGTGEGRRHQLSVVLTNFPYPQSDGRDLSSDKVKAVFQVEPNPDGLTPERWAERTLSQETEVVARRKILVGGEPAVKIARRFEEDPLSYAVYITHKGNIYSLIWWQASDEILDQILATFRFLK
jgi:hypothetical protein